MRVIASVFLILAAAFCTAALVHASINRQPENHDMKTKAQPAGPTYSKAGFDVTPLPQARIDGLSAKLTPEEATVLRNAIRRRRSADSPILTTRA